MLSPLVLSVTVYLSSVGAGFLALPANVLAAIPKLGPVGAVVSSVDANARSSGYYLTAKLAAPMVVNIGALNVSWVRQGTGDKALDFLGVKVGAMNTSVPISCPGSAVVLQLDAQTGEDTLGIQKTSLSHDTTAARIEYHCE